MPNRSLRVSAAVAISIAVTTAARSSRADDKPVKVGVGVLGIAGANFLDKPSDRTIALSNGQRAATDTYPGFAGATLGGGLMADVRFFQVVGLELDFWRSGDHGHGDLSVNGFNMTVDVGQGAWHMPILAKGVLPLGIVQPMVLIGAELVFPGEASATVTPEPPAGSTKLGATADTYAMFTAGLGVEIKLPLPIDLRIPFTIRGSYHGVSDKLEDRADYTLSGNAITAISYRSEWQWQVLGTLGVSVHF